MIKVVTVEGRSYQFKGLTRGQVKQLRSEFPEGGGDEMDRILEMVGVDPDSLDDLLNSSVLELYYAVLELTFPKPEAIKNSKAPSA